MRRYEHVLKVHFYRLWKRRYYRNYDTFIRKMTNTDPFVLSREQLVQLLSFVSNHNAYYARFLCKAQELNSLPILTKGVIRQQFKELQSAKQTMDTYNNSSGGSTGKPVTLVQDMTYQSWSEATKEYHFREFLGVERNTVKNVWLWGSERDLFKLDSWRTKVGLFLQN